MLGKIVTVTVDRAMGTYHPDYPDMYYPINYGYINGIIASDGEEQDAYILGVNEPIKEFTGKIIAIIHRNDDIEEKWVVAPIDKSFSKEEIIKKVSFQEQYFESYVELFDEFKNDIQINNHCKYSEWDEKTFILPKEYILNFQSDLSDALNVFF